MLKKGPSSKINNDDSKNNKGTYGDGNCMFHAISSEKNEFGDFYDKHAKNRRKILFEEMELDFCNDPLKEWREYKELNDYSNGIAPVERQMNQSRYRQILGKDKIFNINKFIQLYINGCKKLGGNSENLETAFYKDIDNKWSSLYPNTTKPSFSIKAPNNETIIDIKGSNEKKEICIDGGHFYNLVHGRANIKDSNNKLVNSISESQLLKELQEDFSYLDNNNSQEVSQKQNRYRDELEKESLSLINDTKKEIGIKKYIAEFYKNKKQTEINDIYKEIKDFIDIESKTLKQDTKEVLHQYNNSDLYHSFSNQERNRQSNIASIHYK